MLKNSRQTDACVVFGVDRIFTVKSPCDGVDQNGCSLVKVQVTTDSRLRHSIGRIKINKHHASHVYVQLFSQQVLEVGKHLQVAHLLWLNAWHLNVQPKALHLATAVKQLLLHRDDGHAGSPRTLHSVDLNDR